MMNFPRFRYHPDPIATGSIEKSHATCESCEQPRGFAYVGPIFAIEEHECVCPWCIADGTAHALLECEFTDRESIGVGGDQRWSPIPDHVADEIAFRTPGFSGWQQERWFTHCGDGAVFLGAMGRVELMNHGPGAIEAIREEVSLDGNDWARYFASLDKDASPTAYLFRCLVCGAFGGYSDCD